MIVIGVDPGLSGGIAFLRAEDLRLVVYPMPTVKKQNGKRDVDPYRLADIVGKHAEVGDDDSLAIVEDVGAMVYTTRQGQVRGQGAAASFNFGKSAGVVLGVLAALGIRVVPVKPSVWKLAMGLSSNKAESIARATFLFPRNSADFGRRGDDGPAEAALLAWMGQDRFV